MLSPRIDRGELVGGRAMTGNTNRLKWLRHTGDEWKWAYSYMQQAPDEGIQRSLRYVRQEREPSYGLVADTIAYLQKTRDGLEFVTRLKNALRQHRHRSLNACKKRKPYSFTLPTDTKKALSAHAKKLEMTETALVADLLDGAGKLLEEHREGEQQLRDALDYECKRVKQLDARWKIQHREAMRQIERLATLLSMWELTFGEANPGFEGDEATLQSVTKKKTREIEKAIGDALKMHTLTEARLI